MVNEAWYWSRCDIRLSHSYLWIMLGHASHQYAKIGRCCISLLCAVKGRDWLVHILGELGRCRPMTIVVRRYPTNHQGVRPCYDLTMGPVGEGYNSFIDDKSLSEIASK